VHAGGCIAIDVAGEDGPRLGALEGEHGVAVGRVRDRHVERRRVRLEPGDVALVVGRVGHGEETVAEAVAEEVVEHPAVLAAEDRVLGAGVGQPRNVVRHQVLEEGLRIGPRGLDLPHVGDVEQAGARPHRHVLLADPLVLHRHLPSGERNEARTGAPMALEQGRTA